MEALNGLYEAIGLILEDPMNILIVLFIAATAFFIVLNFQLSKELRTYRKLLDGVKGEYLEKVLGEYVK